MKKRLFFFICAQISVSRVFFVFVFFEHKSSCFLQTHFVLWWAVQLPLLAPVLRREIENGIALYILYLLYYNVPDVIFRTLTLIANLITYLLVWMTVMSVNLHSLALSLSRFGNAFCVFMVRFTQFISWTETSKQVHCNSVFRNRLEL